MATIPPKIWSWRGHYSGQNILFFQVKKIKGKFPILGPDLPMENDIV
jgi:hypothetical protein